MYYHEPKLYPALKKPAVSVAGFLFSTAPIQLLEAFIKLPMHKTFNATENVSLKSGASSFCYGLIKFKTHAHSYNYLYTEIN